MWQKNKPFWLVLPATVVIGVLFVGGLVEGLVQSLGFFPAADQYSFTLKAYRELLQSSDFWSSLVLTLRVSFLSTLSAGIVGMFVAVCLYMIGAGKKFRRSVFWYKVFQLPLVVPHLVAAYLVMLLFMQSGWFSRILYVLGLSTGMGSFPILTNDPFGWGIIFTYTWKEAPFIALMVYPVLLRIHSSWLEVARVFGANRWKSFLEILLPLIMPAWVSSAFIVFAFTFSAFEVPYVLGVTYPAMLPVLSYNLYTSGQLVHRPDALAINVILSLITAILGAIAYRLNRRFRLGEGGGW